MKVKTILAAGDKADIIWNIYPLYLYDLLEIYGNVPNKYGIYEEDDSIKILALQYHVQDIRFSKPDKLYPFIIYVEEKPAGFALVSTGEYTPKETDYYLLNFSY